MSDSEIKDPLDDLIDENAATDEPPPVLKSWRNIYWVVLINLLLWIALFTYFTWTFQ